MSLHEEGIKSILDKLTDSELFGLANTVTEGLARNLNNTREDAYDCIIKYSTDNLSFLKRKVITREVLFRYLNENNITVQSPFTKHELIQKILFFWKSNSNNNGFTDSTNETHLVKKGDKEVLPNINELATKFAEWFYLLLNANEPIDIVHFWPDCKLKMKLPATDVEISDSVKDIVETLFKTKTEHNLYFNPNLTIDGTQGKIDVYGLVLVLSCGTLHVNNQIVGVYEQVFALARDPSAENNWKIKNMQINLVSKDGVARQPNLTENDLTGNLLSLPDS